MASLRSILLPLFLLILHASAFNIFEQMFQGGGHPHQQQQAPQNAPSDSEWYRKQHEAGMNLQHKLLLSGHELTDISPLHKLSMPRNIILRSLPTSLSMCLSGDRGQGRIGGWYCDLC